MRSRIFFLFLLIPYFFYGKGKVLYEEEGPKEPPPWLTGPLIAPASILVAPGHVDVEPFLYSLVNQGQYDAHWKAIDSPNFFIEQAQLFVEIGVIPWFDVQIIPGFSWKYSQHQGHWSLYDLSIGTNFQLYPEDEEGWIPSMKLTLIEKIPTGKYRNLDPTKYLTDAGGTGLWSTLIAFTMGHLFHLRGPHYINARMNMAYSFSPPVNLKGLSVYGGGYGTRGRFFPPDSFSLDLACEATLSQNWALALDVVGFWSSRPQFHGNPGLGSPIAHRSSAAYSLAPAIEYNWGPKLGLIAGAWFSIAGRNSPVFSSAVVALDYYH